MRQKVRLGILVPSGGSVNTQFALSLVTMCNYLHSCSLPPEFDFKGFVLFNAQGSILPDLRQRLVDDAMEADCTHMLFIDSDMVFPADTFHRLLLANKNIVAANCCTKTMPSNPTARYKSDDPAGDFCYTTAGKAQLNMLEPVWRVGTGVMLIRRSVFEKMAKPWFPMDWDYEEGKWQGEDWGFLEQAEPTQPVIHHSLSWEIGHMGTVPFEPAFIQAQDEVSNASNG